MGQVTRYREEILISADPSAGFDGRFAPVLQPLNINWGDGAGSQQANRFGIASGTLAAAATATIDLKALVGPQGSAVDLAEVRGLRIENLGPGPLAITRAGANPWNGLGASFAMTIPKGTVQLWTDGTDGEIATGASNKALTFTGGTGGCSYRVVAVGTLT
jgi:hypothetical protein